MNALQEQMLKEGRYVAQGRDWWPRNPNSLTGRCHCGFCKSLIDNTKHWLGVSGTGKVKLACEKCFQSEVVGSPQAS